MWCGKFKNDSTIQYFYQTENYYVIIIHVCLIIMINIRHNKNLATHCVYVKERIIVCVSIHCIALLICNEGHKTIQMDGEM